eukprot:TRINITY_DN16068_c0_g1_i1.p1 TRINITY_DN16068_c0_g1~~TRINITY_DN16068_c0_g1_i1.p1  ORF type:complete len:310 (+),score=123.44 TRINITY_DN16068_c0_g1_i1:82-930(+)
MPGPVQVWVDDGAGAAAAAWALRSPEFRDDPEVLGALQRNLQFRHLLDETLRQQQEDQSRRQQLQRSLELSKTQLAKLAEVLKVDLPISHAVEVDALAGHIAERIASCTAAAGQLRRELEEAQEHVRRAHQQRDQAIENQKTGFVGQLARMEQLESENRTLRAEAEKYRARQEQQNATYSRELQQQVQRGGDAEVENEELKSKLLDVKDKALHLLDLVPNAARDGIDAKLVREAEQWREEILQEIRRKDQPGGGPAAGPRAPSPTADPAEPEPDAASPLARV